jgi:ankyrin repeat protein
MMVENKTISVSKLMEIPMIGVVFFLLILNCISPPDRRINHVTDYAYKGDIDGIRRALDSGASIDSRDTFLNNLTALMIASKEGDFLMAEFLIGKGADVNARTRDGHTALMMASYNRFYSIVELLIQNGADVDAVTLQGHTALSESTMEDGKKIQELLIHSSKKKP